MTTNQEKILGILFESPKTTTELAKELRYIDSKGTARYNIIKDDLDKLIDHGYIESKKEKLGKKIGRTPTQYSIKYNIKNLKKILEEYPDLIGSMQENDSVLETILHAHSELTYNITNGKYIKHNGELTIKQNQLNEIEERDIEQTIEQIIDEELIDEELIDEELLDSGFGKNTQNLKKKLKLSREFFRLHLNNETDYLSESIEQLAKALGNGWVQLDYEIIDSPNRRIYVRKTFFKDEMTFKVCVSRDILHRQSNAEAIEYINQLENKVSDLQIETLWKYYKKNQFAPRFLQGQKLIPVDNPKLQEIEDEFRAKGGIFI